MKRIRHECTSNNLRLCEPKFCQRQYVLLFLFITAANLRISFFPTNVFAVFLYSHRFFAFIKSDYASLSFPIEIECLINSVFAHRTVDSYFAYIAQ